jgi:hypothetical protein
VVGAIGGWDNTPGYPFVGPQALGAYLGIAVTTLWAARRHFGRIAAHFLEPRRFPMDDADEPISYRAAVWGVLVGSALLVGFCLWGGMSGYLVAAFFVLYFALAVAITRMRAELGPPVHDAHNTGPNEVLVAMLGPTNVSQQDLVFFSFFHGFNRAQRGHPMPIQLEGFKMAERTDLRNRALFWAMLLAGFGGRCARSGRCCTCVTEKARRARSARPTC